NCSPAAVHHLAPLHRRPPRPRVVTRWCLEDEFTIADRPTLRQLARLDAEYTNALLVMVDSRAARIYEVVLGGLFGETDFANEVPGRHNSGKQWCMRSCKAMALSRWCRKTIAWRPMTASAPCCATSERGVVVNAMYALHSNRPVPLRKSAAFAH